MPEDTDETVNRSRLALLGALAAGAASGGCSSPFDTSVGDNSSPSTITIGSQQYTLFGDDRGNHGADGRDDYPGSSPSSSSSSSSSSSPTSSSPSSSSP
ncbi:MAG: hypothetical protein H6842_11035 [Rhodospirillaceae bacterium]|nr:hypothetical protein [Rhodospirillaceae bacterium]